LSQTLDDLLTPNQLTWIQRHDALLVTTPTAAAERFSYVQLYKLTRKVAPARRAESIRTSVAPESWKIAGGKGDIAPIPPNWILILQSPVIHRQIAATFASSVEPIGNETPIKTGSAMLDKSLSSEMTIQTQAQPLTKLLQQLSAQHQVAITIDSAALNEAEIEPADLNPSLEIVQPRKFSSVLSLALDLSHPELAWLAEGDGLRVTTRSAAMKQISKKTYAIKDIVGQVDGKFVVEAIEYNVYPASWQFGGGDGQIELTDEGDLIVEQCGLVHRELEHLLGALRAGLNSIPAVK
jgi:hypothetical protein